MSKKVVYAKLHDGFFVPGTPAQGSGNYKDTLPPDNKTLAELDMELQDNGALLISWTYPYGGGKRKRTYMIGAATVKGVLFEDQSVENNS